MKPIDAVKDWMDNEPEADYISGCRWDGHKNYWIQVSRENEPDHYSYNFGHETLKGKWTTLTNKRNLTRYGVLKQLQRIKTDYTFNQIWN